MLTVKDGSYYYTDQIGIHDINLTIHQGETVSIMGPNGSGKSTLLKVLVGLYPLQTGTYQYQGQVVDAAYLKDQAKVGRLYQRIGLVFQNSPVQLFNLSVYDEVAFGLRQLNLSSTVVDQRTKDCLDLLGITHLRDRVPYHLSGGEQKLVAIASVLVMNPDVMIFDEPFNGLSPRYRELIANLIQQLKQAGKTMIISSHHFNQIRDLVDRIYVFSTDHTITKEVNLASLTELPNFIDYLDNL